MYLSLAVGMCIRCTVAYVVLLYTYNEIFSVGGQIFTGNRFWYLLTCCSTCSKLCERSSLCKHDKQAKLILSVTQEIVNYARII